MNYAIALIGTFFVFNVAKADGEVKKFNFYAATVEEACGTAKNRIKNNSSLELIECHVLRVEPYVAKVEASIKCNSLLNDEADFLSDCGLTPKELSLKKEQEKRNQRAAELKRIENKKNGADFYISDANRPFIGYNSSLERYFKIISSEFNVLSNQEEIYNFLARVEIQSSNYCVQKYLDSTQHKLKSASGYTIARMPVVTTVVHRLGSNSLFTNISIWVEYADSDGYIVDSSLREDLRQTPYVNIPSRYFVRPISINCHINGGTLK